MKKTTAIALVGAALGTIACVAVSIIVFRQVREELDILRGVEKEFPPYDECDTQDDCEL